MDAVPLADDTRPVAAQLWLLRKHPMLRFERTTNLDPVTGLPTPIPMADSINPASPNFMRWYEPKPYVGTNERCKEPQVVMGVQALRYVADHVYGGRPGCGQTDSQWTLEDWDAWRWVTIRRPRVPDEERTVFWDLPRLRDPANREMVLNTPRVGFMTTMAFFANWPTNLSNSYRVTANQALIVGLSRSFDDRGTTVLVNETTVDDMHVLPGTACFGCHMTLDPMRDFFRQSYSIYYFQQHDVANPKLPKLATFTVDGSTPVTGTGVLAFARAMAGHPQFARAWTQKLCQFANSESCGEDDPELSRVAKAFADSRFQWKTLVRELFSSPLVTFAAPTKTAQEQGVVVSITRREALCAALEHRLKLPDVCSLIPGPLPPGVGVMGQANIRNRARNLALAVPGGGYARGDENPLLPHDPNLFFHAATENLCLTLASLLVDTPAGQNLFISARRDDTIARMVSILMGVPPSDPRYRELVDLLREHHQDAIRSGAVAREATQSTFMLACASPFSVALGL
jgi:hypothetical protein